MSRLRMVTGMAAAGSAAAKGPALAVCGVVRTVLCAVFGALWIVLKALYGVVRVIVPWLALTAVILLLAYVGYLFVGNMLEQAAIEAEATKQETAFGESAEAANDSAEDLEINSRVRALVGSSLGASGESDPDTGGLKLPSLEGVPNEPMQFRTLTARVADHTVRLMTMRSSSPSFDSTGRDYVSVEVDGAQAYLCVTLRDEYGEPAEGLWPWVYKGVGMWEHLLDGVEAAVASDRRQREIDSRFGNLEEGR